MSTANLVSLLCLLITGVIAALGIFSKKFDDSLLQRIGLSGVAVACFLRVPGKFFFPPDPPPEILLAQLSLACYAVGTFIKLSRMDAMHKTHNRRGLGAGI